MREIDEETLSGNSRAGRPQVLRMIFLRVKINRPSVLQRSSYGVLVDLSSCGSLGVQKFHIVKVLFKNSFFKS